jgi:hypothetical protein
MPRFISNGYDTSKRPDWTSTVTTITAVSHLNDAACLRAIAREKTVSDHNTCPLCMVIFGAGEETAVQHLPRSRCKELGPNKEGGTAPAVICRDGIRILIAITVSSG